MNFEHADAVVGKVIKLKDLKSTSSPVRYLNKIMRKPSTRIIWKWRVRKRSINILTENRQRGIRLLSQFGQFPVDMIGFGAEYIVEISKSSVAMFSTQESGNTFK